MPAARSALTFADVPSAVDEEFLSSVAEIPERLRSQSEMRGHPLLASLLAITKDEAVDDLRTRANAFELGGLLSDADDGVIRMARRLACGTRGEEADAPHMSAQLLSFIRA